MGETDLISRKDAIDAVQRTLDEGLSSGCPTYYLGIVPSEQSKIIRCKDCIYQAESWSGIKYCEAHGDHIGKDYDYCSNARRKDNG